MRQQNEIQSAHDLLQFSNRHTLMARESGFPLSEADETKLLISFTMANELCWVLADNCTGSDDRFATCLAQLETAKNSLDEKLKRSDTF